MNTEPTEACYVECFKNLLGDSLSLKSSAAEYAFRDWIYIGSDDVSNF